MHFYLLGITYMPMLVDEPIWGFNRDHIQMSNYVRSIEYGQYMDTIKGFRLYKEYIGDVHTYYLLDDKSKKIVYKSKFLDEYGNHIFSQNLVWRNKLVDSLKGISTILIKEYFLDIYKTVYSDTCQSLDGQRMWVNMMFHYPELEYGYFDSVNYYCIDDLESLYRKSNRESISLYVKQ